MSDPKPSAEGPAPAPHLAQDPPPQPEAAVAATDRIGPPHDDAGIMETVGTPQVPVFAPEAVPAGPGYPAASAIEVAAGGAELTEPIPPPVPSGPYRLPEGAGLALSPEPAKPRQRPLFGPAVSVFAVLLWAFVVAGQYTTTWTFGTPLNEGVAILMVVGLTLAAWIANVRWSGIVMPAASQARFLLRAVGIALVSGLLFGVTLVLATVLGAALYRRSADVMIPIGLVAIATVAAIAGPRLTSPMRPTRTHRGRFFYVSLWLGGVILTLIAGVDLTAYSR